MLAAFLVVAVAFALRFALGVAMSLPEERA